MNARSSGCDSSMMLDLDAADLRQRLAAHRVDERLVLRIGALRIADRSIARIRPENDLRRLAPLDQTIRTGADGPAHHVRARRLDGLARNGHRQHPGQLLEQRVVGGMEPDLQRVAVERAQAFDRRVVVHLRAGLARGVDDRARADDQLGERRVAAVAQVGVEMALDRIHIVLGDQLARLGLEHRIVGEQDSLLHAHRPRLAAVGHLGHRLGGVGDDLGRRGEIVELVERFEDVARDARRIEIGPLLRVEARDVG